MRVELMGFHEIPVSIPKGVGRKGGKLGHEVVVEGEGGGGGWPVNEDSKTGRG